ncbi:YxlC family protein [Cytobacillus spongiae]|jgi:hypothetical protein|uniref:YxlC family protein n=1 Tax=Cytobacillus spongiae TaxID=2901381 RepID=UPI001F1D110B|nr:YxlC family protein [Cytobacillus spongiae]UII56841.1 YxlC family protein [Cytobacillus spongiae]
MKDKKVIDFEREPQDEHDLQAIIEIKEGLNAIEKMDIEATPSLDWFQQMVSIQQQNLRKKLVRDIGIFSFIALFVLTGVLFTLYQLPIVFFILQGIITIGIAIYSGIRFFKQVNET